MHNNAKSNKARGEGAEDDNKNKKSLIKQLSLFLTYFQITYLKHCTYTLGYKLFYKFIS